MFAKQRFIFVASLNIFSGFCFARTKLLYYLCKLVFGISVIIKK